MSQLSFQYWAIDSRGAKTSGVMKAPSRQDAYRRIAATGVTPTRIVAASEQAGGRTGRWRRKVSPQEVAHFTYQLSVLLEARLPVVECFRSIAEQEPNPAFRKIILEVAASVQGGRGITDALTPHRDLFGEVYLQTVRAAETSGNMIKVLAHLAEQVEEQTEMRRAVKGALMYPATVVVALTLGTGFLVTFVVPRFAEMFRGRGVALPVLTEALDVLGTSVRSWWYLYLIAFAGIFLIARAAWRGARTRALVERGLHRVPLLGSILTGLAVGRFASVFGLCLSSGLGLLDTLEMAGKASGRPMLREDVALMIRQVKAGGRLGEVLQQCSYLPGFVKQLFRAGEESAELTRMCQIVSRHYVRETKHLVKNASTVLEPILIALLTGVVLMVALAIFLPMWNMMSLMQ
ncbi:MAG: type II secretion system F family protein [Planctomycetes bacterium]|nr:type II secretion system F family protein [Planctomycetota bacterium]